MRWRTKEFQCLPFCITTDVETEGALLGRSFSSCAVQVHGGLRGKFGVPQEQPRFRDTQWEVSALLPPNPGAACGPYRPERLSRPRGLPLGRRVIRAGVPATTPRGAAHPRGGSPACFWHPRRHVPTTGPVPREGGPAAPCAAPPAAPRRAPPPLPSLPAVCPEGAAPPSRHRCRRLGGICKCGADVRWLRPREQK